MSTTTADGRFSLAMLPTPIMHAERLAQALNLNALYVKRDDLTGFGLAGNKARTLEYLVGDALRRGCDVLVTGGGPRSNYVRGAAAAARVAGLRCSLAIYGDEPRFETFNLALMRTFGAEIRFTRDWDPLSADAAIEEIAASMAEEGYRPYSVPRGGASPQGALGYASAAEELGNQLDAQGISAKSVIVATGSGATQGGLLAGTVASGRSWRVVGATVNRPPEQCRQNVSALAKGCMSLLGAEAPAQLGVEVFDARGPGYAKPSAEGKAAARLAAVTEGLILDPVFTAKSMAALTSLARSGLPGPTVYVHTGGVVAAVEHGV